MTKVVINSRFVNCYIYTYICDIFISIFNTFEKVHGTHTTYTTRNVFVTKFLNKICDILLRVIAVKMLLLINTGL